MRHIPGMAKYENWSESLQYFWERLPELGRLVAMGFKIGMHKHGSYSYMETGYVLCQIVKADDLDD